MNHSKLELDAPSLGEIEKKYLCKAVDSGYISSIGPFIAEFEEKIANDIGIKAAVALQSGTASIHMALYELGIGPGDEVIVPALTFVATVNPVLFVGATPVIIDVDPKTWNIDPIKIKEAITKKTKAIIPVHLYGNPCQMDEIMTIAKEYNLYIIEDATESLGALYHGCHTGTFGDFGCFSFNGNKLITTGGGGMIVSNDKDRIEHIRYLINQAKDKDRAGFHSEMGFNFRMTNIEAALGLAQLEQMNIFLEKKKIFKDIYKDILKTSPQIFFQAQYPHVIGNNWLTCVKFGKNINISHLIQRLSAKGVPVRRVFMPLCDMPYLKKYSRICSNAADIYAQGLCLPSSTLNNPDDVRAASYVLRDCL